MQFVSQFFFIATAAFFFLQCGSSETVTDIGRQKGVSKEVSYTTDPNKVADSNTDASTDTETDSTDAEEGTIPEKPLAEEVTIPLGSESIFAELHSVESKKIIILIHSKESNHGEFAHVHTNLNLVGFDTLALDLRAGVNAWNTKNKTVEKRGLSIETRFVDEDVKAAISWAQKKKYSKILLMGSGMGASLAIRIACNDRTIDGVIAFSPEGYWITESIYNYAGQVYVPFFGAAPLSEKLAVSGILNSALGSLVTKNFEEKGDSGVMLLKNETVFKALLEFLKKHFK